MINLQKDAIYQSLLRSLTVYAGKISDAYNNSEKISENLDEYQNTLINLYPVMENVCRELNNSYGAQIRIPKIDADSIVEEADNIAYLISAAKNEFKNNPELSDSRILFSLKSDAVRHQLSFVRDYIETMQDSEMQNKAGYWLYHNVQAMDGYWQVLAERHEHRLWDSLNDAGVADVIASQHWIDNYKKDNGLDWSEVLLNSFYYTGLDYLASSSKKNFDFQREVLNFLHDDYNVNISDTKLQRLLKSNQNVIKDIWADFEDEHILIHEIGDILDEFDEGVSFYEDEAIRNLISSEETNNNIVSIDDEDIQTFILEYPEISALAENELDEYNLHQDDEKIFENYEEDQIDNELKFALSLKLKEWLVQTAKDTKKIIPQLANMAVGQQHFSNEEEKRRFVDKTLELSLDTVLVSAGVFDYVPNTANGKTGVMLNTSMINEGYIKKLIERKDQLTEKDYKKLHIFLNEFQSTYEYNSSVLGFTPEELAIRKNFNLPAYVECLEEQPDCFDKLNISYLSARMFGVEAEKEMEKLSEAQKEFIQGTAHLYQEEKEILKDYLQSGAHFNPRLDVEEGMVLADSVVMPLVIMPMYDPERYSENNYLQGMDYAVAKSNIDDASKPFVKSAINGYKKMIEKRGLALSEEAFHPYLNYLAKGYYQTLDKLQEISEANNAICDIHSRQEEIFDRWQKFDEYKNNQHPDKNQITASLIKNKDRGRK